MRFLYDKRFLEIAIIAALMVLILLPGCRTERPPLDRNKAPETYLTSSPPETTETHYKVHLYWHGADGDGVVSRYIWYISDTLLTLEPAREPDVELADWNPANRIMDYLRGRFTDKTDSVFSFQGYNSRINALVNRQAFHIAAIDDGGKIDQTPARLQFLAKVAGVPKVKFWAVIDGYAKEDSLPGVPQPYDTISMKTPFFVRFSASTVNNVITGYKWMYGDKEFPRDRKWSPAEWYIPEPGQVVEDTLTNMGDAILPDGTFYFKVVARDEAGALSRSDILSGEGYCIVEINHDPDTRVKYAWNFYTPQGGPSASEPCSLYYDFWDASTRGAPDTLPYNSRFRFHYVGWDDPKDIPHLLIQPPRPMRFQFRFQRSTPEGQAFKRSPWYPMEGPEDTNPGADLDSPVRNEDSTTIRVGTFDYAFMVKSYDEMGRDDGVPDTIRFIGNYPPTVDSMMVGYIDPVTFTYQKLVGDTLYLSWLGASIGSDTLGFCEESFDLDLETITRSYCIILKAYGHDSPQEPRGSGIRGWKYFVNAGEEYPYIKQGDWLFDEDFNRLEQNLTIKLTVPFSEATGDQLVSNPPGFLGNQEIEVIGIDIGNKDTDIFREGIRGRSPIFEKVVENGDTTYVRVSDGTWVESEYRLAKYARADTLKLPFYVKVIK